MGFSGGLDAKESACNAGDLGSIPGSGRSPGKTKRQPTPVFLLGKSHGQKSLVGYSPWGHKESDTTEQLTFFITSQLSFLFSFSYLFVMRKFKIYSANFKYTMLPCTCAQSCPTLQSHGLYIACQAPLSMECSRLEY